MAPAQRTPSLIWHASVSEQAPGSGPWPWTGPECLACAGSHFPWEPPSSAIDWRRSGPDNKI